MCESAAGFFGNASYTESRPALRLPFALALRGDFLLTGAANISTT
jgi:hypothetical protein